MAEEQKLTAEKAADGLRVIQKDVEAAIAQLKETANLAQAALTYLHQKHVELKKHVREVHGILPGDVAFESESKTLDLLRAEVSNQRKELARLRKMEAVAYQIDSGWEPIGEVGMENCKGIHVSLLWMLRDVLPELEATPETEYFVQCLKDRNTAGMAIWWRPNNAGYTPCVEQAGRYSQAAIDANPDYYNDGVENRAIRCDLVERLARRVVDVHRIQEAVKGSQK